MAKEALFSVLLGVGMLCVSTIINRLEPIEPKLARFNK